MKMPISFNTLEEIMSFDRLRRKGDGYQPEQPQSDRPRPAMPRTGTAIVHPRQRADEPVITYAEYVEIHNIYTSMVEELFKATSCVHNLKEDVFILEQKLMTALTSLDWFMMNINQHYCDRPCEFCTRMAIAREMVDVWMKDGA